jgi:hypothetical protein
MQIFRLHAPPPGSQAPPGRSIGMSRSFFLPLLLLSLVSVSPPALSASSAETKKWRESKWQ